MERARNAADVTIFILEKHWQVHQRSMAASKALGLLALVVVAQASPISDVSDQLFALLSESGSVNSTCELIHSLRSSMKPWPRDWPW